MLRRPGAKRSARGLRRHRSCGASPQLPLWFLNLGCALRKASTTSSFSASSMLQVLYSTRPPARTSVAARYKCALQRRALFDRPPLHASAHRPYAQALPAQNRAHQPGPHQSVTPAAVGRHRPRGTAHYWSPRRVQFSRTSARRFSLISSARIRPWFLHLQCKTAGLAAGRTTHV